MKRRYILPVLLLSSAIYAQQGSLTHQVTPGETLYAIAKKYQVLITNILNENPQITDYNLITVGSIIKLPANAQKASATENSFNNSTTFDYHEVVAGETKFGLAKKYQLTIAQLEGDNPQIVPTLQIGQRLKIRRSSKSTLVKQNLSHTVVSGETLQSIAEKYQTSVTEIIQANNLIQPGQVLLIPTQLSQTQPIVGATESRPNESVKKEGKIDSVSNDKNDRYLVQAGDTKFSLAKRFNTSIEVLESLNPSIKSVLKSGVWISVPSGTSVVNSDQGGNTKPQVVISQTSPGEQTSEKSESVTYSTPEKQTVDLTASLVNPQQKQVLVISSKTDESLVAEVQKAVKKATTTGLSAKIESFDVDQITEINSYLSQHKVDLIIGEYHPQINAQNTPYVYTQWVKIQPPQFKVYSGNSKYSALETLLDYITSKDGTITVINDVHFASDKEAIASFAPKAKFAVLKDRVTLDTENFQSLLSKSQKNYVVLNTNSSELFLNVTNFLLNNAYSYDFQLAITQPIPNHVSLLRARLLHTLYPSSLLDTKITNSNVVEIAYDALLRTSQKVDFETSIKTQKTSNFDYYTKDNQLYYNNKVQVLFYNSESDSNLAP